METKDAFMIGIPTLAILVGVLLQHRNMNHLDSRITGGFRGLRPLLQGEADFERMPAKASLQSSIFSGFDSLKTDINGLKEEIRLMREDRRKFYRSRPPRF